jgi:transposase
VSNVLNEEKKQQVIALGRLGWSLRKIQKTTGVRRETAADYLRAAGIGLRPPGAWGRGAPAKPANEVTPDPGAAKPANRAELTPDSGAVLAPHPADTANASASRSACELHRETIELELSKGRNAKGIWQDLVDSSGFVGGYQSVKRFIRNLRGQSSPEACAVIETSPGEECQVDYGSGPLVRDADSGKYRRTRLFVLTLGYSRKAVRFLLFRSSSQVWAELHEKAFRRLGGVTRVVVLDNLREGVLQPDVYDPALNPLYRDVLSHYGSVALACRVRDPDRKGKVESGVGHAKKTPLKGQRFESLDEAQAYLDHWEERWADTRIHGTTNTASARSIWMAAWKSMRPTTVRRQGGSARRFRCNGITVMSACCTRKPANC